MFIIAISCLNTSNLPWFIDLTFQVPMQQCSLQHRTFTSIHIQNCVLFPLWLSLSFFLELSLQCSPVAYWTSTDLGGSSFSVISFYLFILFMGFSMQERWSGLPFPSPVDHLLWELSLMTHPSWVAPMAWLIVSLSYTSLWSYNQFG